MPRTVISDDGTTRVTKETDASGNAVGLDVQSLQPPPPSRLDLIETRLAALEAKNPH